MKSEVKHGAAYGESRTFSVPYRYRSSTNLSGKVFNYESKAKSYTNPVVSQEKNDLYVFPTLAYVSRISTVQGYKDECLTERSKTLLTKSELASSKSNGSDRLKDYFITKAYFDEKQVSDVGFKKNYEQFTKVESLLEVQKRLRYTGVVSSIMNRERSNTVLPNKPPLSFSMNREDNLLFQQQLQQQQKQQKQLKQSNSSPLWRPVMLTGNNKCKGKLIKGLTERNENDKEGRSSSVLNLEDESINSINTNNSHDNDDCNGSKIYNVDEQSSIIVMNNTTKVKMEDNEPVKSLSCNTEDDNDDDDDDEEVDIFGDDGDDFWRTEVSNSNCFDDDDDDYIDDDCYTGEDTYENAEISDLRSDTQSPTQEMLEEVQKKLNAEGNACLPKPPLIYSIFPNVPPVVRFVREGESVMSLPPECRRQLKWRFSAITPNVVKRTVKRSGFKLKDKAGPNWIGFYGKSLKASAYRSVLEHQKVNHLPGSFQIGRKDKLWRNISILASKNGKGPEFKFLPKTYCLPGDLKYLERVWDDDDTRKRVKWIMKPPASARGIGVKMVSRWNQIPKKNPTIIQNYVSRPFLINGSKFDLRIYVAVTSMDPLRIYIYRDGLVRFASLKYSKSSKNLNNKFIHLTNYSINKKNENYTSNEDHSKCQGHKWTLLSLWKYMDEELNIDWRPIWSRIKDFIIKTIISVESHINSYIKMYCQHKGCVFELFGFDVILDSKLRPWVLEVNVSPSLHSNSPLDIEVKSGLIADLFNLVGFHLYHPMTNTSTISNISADSTGVLSRISANSNHRNSQSAPSRTRSPSVCSTGTSASINRKNSSNNNNNNSSNTNKKVLKPTQKSALNPAANTTKKKLKKSSTSSSLLTCSKATPQARNSNKKSPSYESSVSSTKSKDKSNETTMGPVMKEYKILADVMFQQRGYYTRSLTPNEKQKHKFYIRKGYYDDPDIALTIINQLTMDDARILIESIDEFQRAGQFEVVFPCQNRTNAEQYLSYIANNSGCIYYNCLLREFLQKYSVKQSSEQNAEHALHYRYRVNETGMRLLHKYAARLNTVENLDTRWSPPTKILAMLSKSRTITPILSSFTKGS